MRNWGIDRGWQFKWENEIKNLKIFAFKMVILKVSYILFQT